MNRTKLFDLSKCFLANRDNFCPYEQGLTHDNLFTLSHLTRELPEVNLAHRLDQTFRHFVAKFYTVCTKKGYPLKLSASAASSNVCAATP